MVREIIHSWIYKIVLWLFRLFLFIVIEMDSSLAAYLFLRSFLVYSVDIIWDFSWSALPARHSSPECEHDQWFFSNFRIILKILSSYEIQSFVNFLEQMFSTIIFTILWACLFLLQQVIRRAYFLRRENVTIIGIVTFISSFNMLYLTLTFLCGRTLFPLFREL